MKRCPTCHQEFADEWLTFCTQDGTALVPIDPEPEPTLYRAPMPPSVSPSEQPTLDFPDSNHAPPAPFGQPQPLQGTWLPPPPPPAYPTGPPPHGLAIASLIVGISSITFGLCCWLGVALAPTAIILGIAALVQLKNHPGKNTGKPLAIIGIVAGGLYFIVLSLIILFYGFVLFSGFS